jgi:nitrogen fixation NifU-like protein
MTTPKSTTAAPGDLAKLYQAIILEHAKSPHNRRQLEHANRQAHRNNPLCGDRVTVYVRDGREHDIAEAAFEGEGCAISLASASILTDVVGSLPKETALALAHAIIARLLPESGPNAGTDLPSETADRQDIQAVLSVANFPMRAPCAALAWEALVDAVTDSNS